MKIPENAKIVFDGIIYQVYQWEQEMFDGSFRIFEEVVRPSSVFAIPIINNKVLVSYQKQPNRKDRYRSLIWWRVDKWEKSLDGAKRELLEETWMQWETWIHWFEKKMTPINWKLDFYIVKNCEIIQKPKKSSWEDIKTFELDFEVFIEMAINGVFYNDALRDTILIAKRENKMSSLHKLLIE